MPPPPDPRFNWLSVIVIAIGLALVALAVVVRSGGSSSGPVTGQSASIDPGPSLPILGGSILFALVALLGDYCGYLGVISRLRKDSEAQDSSDTSREI